MKNIFLALALLWGVIILPGCSGNKNEKQPGEEAYDSPATNKPANEASAQLAYICPMQCEGSASNEPGKCPVCSMDLVKNPNYKGSATDSAATNVVN